MSLHCAPLQHTRTPAKPRIQNVQKAAILVAQCPHAGHCMLHLQLCPSITKATKCCILRLPDSDLILSSEPCRPVSSYSTCNLNVRLSSLAIDNSVRLARASHTRTLTLALQTSP